MTSSVMGRDHHVTIPRHTALKVGTLSGILNDIAQYLDVERDAFLQELFR